MKALVFGAVVLTVALSRGDEDLVATLSTTTTTGNASADGVLDVLDAVLDDRGLHRYRRAALLAVDVIRRGSARRVTAFVCWGREEASLIRLFSSAGMSTQFLRGPDNTRAEALRRQLSDSLYSTAILVDAACPFAPRLLTVASRLRLFHVSNVWVIFENGLLAEEELDLTESFDGDFDDVEQVAKHRFGAQDWDAAVDPKEDAFLEITPPTPHRARQDLLQQQTDMLSTAALSILDEKIIYVDSHVVWVQANNMEVRAFEVFRSCMARPLQAYLVAESTESTESDGYPLWRWVLNGSMEALLRERRADLQGATLRGSTIIKYPEEYTDIEDNNLRQNDLYPKMNYPVSQNMAYSLNFGFLIYKRDNYGWDDGHGRFDGMMGEMQRYEHDMLATAVFIRADRLPIIDMVAETFDMRTAILFRQPSKSSVSNVYVLPFSPGVWRATGVVSLLAMLLLVVQTQWWRRHYKPPVNGEPGEPGDHLDVGDCVTFIVGALSQQGFHCTPAMVSARITIITTFIANLFLFTSFSGSIVAIIQSPSDSLRSVHDLIASEMRMGVQDIRFQHVWFQESEAEHDVAAELFRKKIKTHDPPGYVVTREGIKKVRRGGYAFQVETNEGYKEILDTFTEAEKCDLSELELYPAAPMVFCTTEKSPYREITSRNLRWQRETGLLDRIHNMWESQRPGCSAHVKVFVPIGLQEFYPVLIVLYNGVLLALTVLAVERVYNSRMLSTCVLRCWKRRSWRGMINGSNGSIASTVPVIKLSS